MSTYHVSYVCTSTGGFGRNHHFGDSKLELKDLITEADLEEFKNSKKATTDDGITIISIFKFEESIVYDYQPNTERDIFTVIR